MQLDETPGKITADRHREDPSERVGVAEHALNYVREVVILERKTNILVCLVPALKEGTECYLTNVQL